MTDKALKQYIYEKYDLKVKKTRFFGKYYTLSYNYDSQGGTWEMTSYYDKYGHILCNRLFNNLADIIDAIEHEDDFHIKSFHYELGNKYIFQVYVGKDLSNEGINRVLMHFYGKVTSILEIPEVDFYLMPVRDLPLGKVNVIELKKSDIEVNIKDAQEL